MEGLSPFLNSIVCEEVNGGVITTDEEHIIDKLIELVSISFPPVAFTLNFTS